MNAPDPAGYAVETTNLLDESKLWDDQGHAMEGIGKEADALRFSEMGVHTVFIPKYHHLVDAVVARCNEALARMGEVRDTLKRIAMLYEATEERHAQQFKNKHHRTP